MTPETEESIKLVIAALVGIALLVWYASTLPLEPPFAGHPTHIEGGYGH